VPAGRRRPGGPAGSRAAQPAPQITASPATDHADGQEITVTGSGFAPGQAVTIQQCDDVLCGRGGDDILLGGPGHDHADGGSGHDRCQAERRRSCP
jgi:hypothetical protein